MPKLALAVNVWAYACSSRSGREMAQASLNDQDAWEDDSQTLHMPVHCIVRRDGGGHGELATERIEASRGSPSWQPYYQMDVGEEEAETLESYQSSLDGHLLAKEEVPWYKLVILLMSGADGTALSLAKCLLMAWRCSIKVRGEDICPPAPTIFNIGQFMTEEEVAEGVGEPHWFMAYSHTLQQVGKAAHRWKWEWPMREALEVKVSPLVHAFWEETGMDLTMACIKLCLGAHP